MTPQTPTSFKAKQASTLILFLGEHLKISQRAAKRLLDQRCVFVNHQRIWMAKHTVKVGDVVEVSSPVQTSSPKAHRATSEKLVILFEDDQYLITNKLPGRLTHQDPKSIEAQLREQTHNPALCAIHRLDKDTSGCLLFGKTRAIWKATIPLFKRNKVEKKYRALILGQIEKPQFRIRTAISNQPSITQVKILKQHKGFAFAELTLVTGRKHQARIHLASIGHPILGDKTYLTQKLTDPKLRAIPRQMLHAYSLSFPQPTTEKFVRVTAPLPRDFKNVLNSKW